MRRLNAAIAAAGAASSSTFGSVVCGENQLVFEAQAYVKGGDAPLRLQLYLMEDGQLVAPYGTVTTCVPGERAEEDEVLVKTHFENEILRAPLLATGYFVDTGRRVPVGRGDQVEVWKITAAFVSAFAAATPFDHPSIAKLPAAPVAPSPAIARAPGAAQCLVEATQSAVDLFEIEFARLQKAIATGDLSGALVPRVGDDARIELQTRLSMMQWVLEMLPSREKLELNAGRLREEAISMLKLASAMDGRSLQAITHSHRHGDDTHFVWGKGIVDDEAAGDIINARSSYEPHFGETLVVTMISLDQLADVGDDMALSESDPTPQARG
jgi:hypothetical protein